jgi:hypothetical protein
LLRQQGCLLRAIREACLPGVEAWPPTEAAGYMPGGANDGLALCAGKLIAKTGLGEEGLILPRMAGLSHSVGFPLLGPCCHSVYVYVPSFIVPIPGRGAAHTPGYGPGVRRHQAACHHRVETQPRSMSQARMHPYGGRPGARPGAAMQECPYSHPEHLRCAQRNCEVHVP